VSFISAIFPVFFGHFDHLLNSGEKSNNRPRNCLTALKTANIMPDGSRDFILATRFDGRAFRSVVETASVVRGFSKLSTGLAGQTGIREAGNRSPAIAYVRFRQLRFLCPFFVKARSGAWEFRFAV